MCIYFCFLIVMPKAIQDNIPGRHVHDKYGISWTVELLLDEAIDLFSLYLINRSFWRGVIHLSKHSVLSSKSCD